MAGDQKDRVQDSAARFNKYGAFVTLDWFCGVKFLKTSNPEIQLTVRLRTYCNGPQTRKRSRNVVAALKATSTAVQSAPGTPSHAFLDNGATILDLEKSIQLRLFVAKGSEK
jgi:hypothetical protein